MEVDPTLYSYYNCMQKHDADRFLDQYSKKMAWGEQEKILDVGCGSGDVTYYVLAPHMPVCARIIGVDVSEEMTEFAEKNYCHRDERLQFRQTDITTDIQRHQIIPEGFSKIFSFYCLHWIQDYGKVLANLFNLSLPNGEILLIFMANAPIFGAYELLSKKPKWTEYMKDVDSFIPVYQHSVSPAKEFGTLCEKAGFQVLTCQADWQTFTFESTDYVKGAMTVINPFLKRIPCSLQDDYTNDCMLDLQRAQGCPSYDGIKVAKYRLMVVHLKKPCY